MLLILIKLYLLRQIIHRTVNEHADITASLCLCKHLLVTAFAPADNRREASFAVRPGETIRSASDREAIREARREKRAEKKQAAKAGRTAKKQNRRGGTS